MTSDTTFADLGLSQAVLESLARIGYEAPTPIQAQSIPPLLDGRDLLGTAQTGTGKTAAFALPLLSRIDVSDSATQVLVLAPTRELAIQVSEAFENYARGIRGFHVLPIYGGQSMGIQLKQLRRGAQVVVGTPGRVMDHLRRGTLKLDALRAVVLDEADEMLRMGFIEDVQWILEHTPDSRQVALFSATMPQAIQRVADTYLKNPAEIRIESKTSTVERIEQKFWIVAGTNKLDALTRILEVEDTDGVIVFVRTKLSSENLASRLEARGHAAAAINGDLSQAQREATIARLKSGAVDILVATDVAARGIDVDRISHVVNFDIPTDTESYVHRIGRTGARAARARRSSSLRRGSAACCTRSNVRRGRRWCRSNCPASRNRPATHGSLQGSDHRDAPESRARSLSAHRRVVSRGARGGSEGRCGRYCDDALAARTGTCLDRRGSAHARRDRPIGSRSGSPP